MLHNIPDKILTRMRHLEALDARDRVDGTPHKKRLRQIPPDTGRFIAILAAAAPEGTMIEIGASAGYSTLYLALACRETGRRIITFEILEEKAKLAEETFQTAEVNDVVELIRGDARQHLHKYNDISFCFLDADKEMYLECYELAVAHMISGGLLVADNVISHKDIVQPMIHRAMNDDRVDSVIIPLDRGLLVSRKI